MTQFELGKFEDGDDDDRLAEEASAVAGDDTHRASQVDTSEQLFPPVEESVEIAVMQADYTIEGSGADEYPVIHVFGRTDNQELVHAKVLGFRPYFYAPAENITEGRLTEYDRITGWAETDDGEPYESIRGQRLVKIFGQTPRDVGRIRDEFDHFEADILFPNRFLIDKDITNGVRLPARDIDEDGDRRTLRVSHDEVEPVSVDATPRVNTFDIEVDDRSGFPEDGEETIICIASHDSTDDEYILWLYEPPEGETPPEELPDYDPIETDEDRSMADLDVDIRSYETEEAMLDGFLTYIEETDPDLATGWNFTDFDAPYLLDRLDVLNDQTEHNLDVERLSRVDEVWRSDWQGPDVKGRVMFDLLYAYQRTQFTELDSYKLEDVGQLELGVGKELYTGDIGDLWETDPERLLEYNLRDVELCVELDREQDIIAFWNEVRQFVGCKIEDATTPGDAVDMYVLHKLHDDFALPSKGSQSGEEYEGGAVFDPITGVRENVSVLDLKCFSPDTEVLTPDGPRNITEIEEGEDVYTLNPETFECEVKPVAETQEYKNRFGELHHLSGNTHDFKITENHRLLYSKERGWDEQAPEDFELAEYRDIPEYERFAFPQHEEMPGRIPETFDLVDAVEEGNVVVYYEDDLREFRNRMPASVTESLDLIHGSSAAVGLQKKVGKYLIPVDVYRQYRGVINDYADEVFLKFAPQHRETPCSFEMANWLELVGWYVTEGSVDVANGRLTIHQDESTEREAICVLLDEMGINYNVDNRGVNVSNRYLLDWFVENCGKGYSDKRLPEWVFDLDGELLKVLLDAMIRGDGSRADSGLGKFWTKSESLKDGIARIAVRCGHKPTVSKQSDGTWYVSIDKRGSFKKSTNATVEDHDGKVFCITAADNHVVLAGRNGNFQWIGQSLYPMCMVTTNASPETKVNPEAYDGETYRAPNGTHFRKEPDGVIREMVDELLEEREEKKSMRNQHDPDSTEYGQYDRQQQAVKVIMNCFTPDTEVLTPDGVRNIRDLEIGDQVYSLDPETLEMEVKSVTETHAYPDYRGELVDIETSKIDFSVTPNHRMLVRKNETNGITEDQYRFVEAGNLNDATNYQLPHDWNGPDGNELDKVDLTELLDCEYEVWANNEGHGHTLAAEIGWYPDKMEKQGEQGTGYVFSADEFNEHREYLDDACSGFYVHRERGQKWIPRFYNGDDFLELLAWYITEGNVYTSTDKQFGDNFRGSATTVQIAQEAIPDGGQNSDHAAMGKLLDRMGFDPYVDERGYQFTSRLLGDWLEANCGADSFEKRIPEFIFDLSQRQKRRFLETLIAGDGDRQVNSWRYSTASEQLRDDVLRLCAHLGLTTSYNEDSGAYRIYVTEDSKNTLRMHRSAERTTADDGVYCVTVADNHTLLAGRNGKFQFVGQSLYGVLGWDRFRLYDREMGAAVTATGRKVIEYTDEVVQQQGYEVVYGDTDSVMLEVGGVGPDDVKGDVEVTAGMREKHPEMDEEELLQAAATIQKGFELEEIINDSYDDFALEQLNAEFHRFEIEFEKLYRRFFQAGKKKRYAGHIVWKEGKDVDDIDITGFEYQRSDIAPITKRVQKEVIDMIVKGEDREEIKAYVNDVIEDFQAGNVDYDDVGIPGGIGKRLDNYDTDTAQVRGAKYANLLLGTNFQRGSKPKRLYLDRVHANFFERVEAKQGLDPDDPLYKEFRRDPDVICFQYSEEIPEEFEVDWEKMLDKTLKGPIARILEALDISWEEVKAGQEQTGLGEFM